MTKSSQWKGTTTALFVLSFASGALLELDCLTKTVISCSSSPSSVSAETHTLMKLHTAPITLSDLFVWLPSLWILESRQQQIFACPHFCVRYYGKCCASLVRMVTPLSTNCAFLKQVSKTKSTIWPPYKKFFSSSSLLECSFGKLNTLATKANAVLAN